MRSDWVGTDDIGHVLALLMPTNRLVMEVALHTGLRVGDVLALRSERLAQRMTVKEEKTGKSRRISFSRGLYERLRAQAGKIYVFEGRRSQEVHRTRQAVWADISRAAKALRLTRNVTPHSARKIYAVELYKRYGSLDLAQRQLNHDNLETTLLYIMADTLAARRAPRAKARPERTTRARMRTRES